MTERTYRPRARVDQAYKNMWTGDVWKLVPILHRWRPDLEIRCLDCPPTGLVLCTNLDPASTVLADAYNKILAEWDEAVPDQQRYERWRASVNVESAAEFLNRLAADPVRFDAAAH
jgi:hypothetical protein